MSQSEIIFYTAPDGKTKLQVNLEDETVWLTQQNIADLFEVDKRTISEHLGNIYDERELERLATVRKFRTVRKEGKRAVSRDLEYYNLDAIIAVGYRVNSKIATQFRIWATQRLREYIVKGFTMDDERLKGEGGRSRYFEELLQRVRDIRSSERNFYQKVTDIYATSIDYKKDDALTQEFFATVQNKMHYAVHGQTAAELIESRADAQKPFMGLTNFKGKYVTIQDTAVAKNYLSEDELKRLNLIVSMYLDFAELQAVEKKAMRMADWVKKLDDFLRASDKQLLGGAGRVSHAKAARKASDEYAKYREAEDEKYVSDFDREVKKLLKNK
jgi:hypothetical protein